MTAGLRFDTVTCLTDLGRADESAGLVHSILRERCGPVAVVDLCHDVEPGDTRAAALMLARSVPHLVPGVVLVSVGRRLERPAIAVAVGDGQAALVGPDNGVLAAAVATVGGADAAVRLDSGADARAGLDAAAAADAALRSQSGSSPGVTAVTLTATAAARGPDDDAGLAAAVHPARDVLAPAAARLCLGEPLADIGEPVDPALLLPSMLAVPRTDGDGTLVAEVVSVDRSGVAQLNIDRAALTDAGLTDVGPAGAGPFTVEFGDERRLATLAPPPGSGCPVAAAPGRLIFADDVHTMLEVLVGGGESAAGIGLVVGTEVRLREAR